MEIRQSRSKLEIEQKVSYKIVTNYCMLDLDFSISFAHLELLRTPNLYISFCIVITTTFFMRNPSAFDVLISTKGISSNNSSVLLERVARVPSVF